MWNGRFRSKRLHPLFVFTRFGDPERCALRPGNVHSADGREYVLKACAGAILDRGAAFGRATAISR